VYFANYVKDDLKLFDRTQLMGRNRKQFLVFLTFLLIPSGEDNNSLPILLNN